MAQLEKAIINGEEIPLGSGLEGRIASSIGRRGAGTCVILQVGISRNSYSFAFPAGCAGGGAGGGGGSPPPEFVRLNEIYLVSVQEIRRNSALIRKAVMEFIMTL